MKNFILGVLMLGMIACANLPNVELTDAQGNTIAMSIDRVAYIDQDGKHIDCRKEADVWSCSYKDENGNVIKIDNIDVGFLEEKNEQSK